jgi:5-deoxy-glucuronate isomerase
MMNYITSNDEIVELTNRTNHYPGMMLYSYLVRPKKGSTKEYFDNEKETLILLQEGNLTLEYNGQSHTITRGNVFDDAPVGLLFPKDVKVKVTINKDSEYLLFQTENDKTYDVTLYGKDNVVVVDRGAGQWNDCATRNVRTMCDYKINPKSNMAFGETVNYPGKWSTFIPHLHDQPELYYYRFNKPQGFGASFYGDNVYEIKDRSYICVTEKLAHPQVTAPGYAMNYFWIIRHFDNNPWTGAENVKEHEWLLDPNCKIWPEK